MSLALRPVCWCPLLLAASVWLLCCAWGAVAVQFNYSVFYVADVGCALAADSAGSYYVGLCDQATVLKFSSGFQLQSSFDTQVATSLTALSSNSSNTVTFGGTMAISASNVLWFNDDNNFRLLGVSDLNPSSVLVIPTAGINGAWEIGVSPSSNNVWAVSLCNPQTGAVQYAPNGTILSAVGAVSDPTNLPSTYCVMGVQPDNSGAYVYVGGCQLTGPTGIVYYPELGEFSFNASAVGQCDIRKVSISSGQVVQVIQPTRPAYVAAASNVSFWEDMAFSPVTNDLYASDYYSGLVYHIDSNGSTVSNFSIGSDVAFTPAGNVVTLGSYGFTIDVLSPDGVPQSVANVSSQQFAYPVGVAVGPGGSPVYSISEVGQLAVFNTAGSITGYIGGGVLQDPISIATDSSGAVYVGDDGNSVVYKFSPSGALLMNFTDPLLVGSNTASLNWGLAVNPTNGQVLASVYNYTYTGNGYIVVFSSTGQVVQRIPAISPVGVAVTSSGSVVYAEQGVYPAAVVTVAPSGSTTQFNVSYDWLPWAVAVSPDNRIFVSDEETNLVTSFNLQGQTLAVVSPTAYNLFVISMGFASQGNVLYCVDFFNSRLVAFRVGSYGSNPTVSAASSAMQGSAAAATVLALSSAVVAMVMM